MQATEALRIEHEIIQQVLDCIDELVARAEHSGTLDVPSARDALEFLAVFADRCHHTKEEMRLFPALIAKGLPREFGPIPMMLHEHELGRTAIAAMRTAVEAAARHESGAHVRFVAAARSYVELLREHIAKENGVLFPIADQMFCGAELESLLSSFEHIEQHDLGPGTHGHYLALARRLCDHLNVAWGPHASSAHACCGHASHHA